MVANWCLFVLFSWLLADFISGFWHWLEDRYFEESWPIIGKYVAKPNTLHHEQPQEFLNHSYLYRNWTTFLPAGVVAAVMVAIGCPMHWLLPVVFVSHANEIHAWAHQKGKLSKVVLALQDIGLLQSCRHHGEHHRSPFEVKYCVISNWLNPILDGLHFWRFLEFIVAQTLRIKPKES